MASLGPADNTNQLQITDLAKVLQLLKRHGYSGTSYYDLGLYLGLSPATLDIITKNNKGDTESCLRECLTKWLQKADDVQKKGSPTIYSLVSALRELGENAVADGIDMDMHPACRIFARYTSSFQILVIQLVLLLHSESLIKEMVLSANTSGEALLVQIKEAVCNDHRKLEVFATISCKVTAAAEIGIAINKEYREAFCKSESLMINSENGEELKFHFPQSMIAEFKTMRLKFGSTFSSVKNIMKKNPQAFEKIRDILNFSYPALKPQLAQCQDINSILELISKNCSLNDISMLEFFVTGSKLDELVQIIEEYNEAIKKFSETKLTEYLEGELSYASPLQCERITIVVDRKTDDCTLDDVRILSADTFHELSRHIKLNVIRDGDSFTITCSFPLVLSEQLITAALCNIDVLKENKVKRLTIGYCTVYEVKDTSTATTTEIDEYISSLSTRSGLSKQLMLSLSVQLINSTEEVTTFKGRLSSMEKMKEQLETELKQKEKDLQQEKAMSKKEIESLNGEVAIMRRQLIERETQLKDLKISKSPQEKNPLTFEDDIYGDIVIEHPLINEIVQTRQFQRLKDIKVLGYAYQNMPRATYSRLQHSIGMYYIAGEYIERIRKNQPELDITDSDVLCVKIAALCYNLGHGPFSHVFEMFLDEICTRGTVDKPWKNVFEASVKMFEYMLEDNKSLMDSFKKYLDDHSEDIEFIKELIQGTGFKQRKLKRFLYEIVYNKKSGLDVSMIDSAVRDAAVLGKNFTFRRRVFFNDVRVLTCDDGQLHTCFPEDDLDTYNDLFTNRQTLFRDLHYLRKNRIVALMIKRILVKSNEIPIIKDEFRRVTLSDATKNMFAYSQLNDTILSTIKLLVDDTEALALLDCLDTMKVIGQIGYVTSTNDWNEDKIKQHIVRSIESSDITDQLILDPIKTGYENWNALTQYYYTNDGKTGQWTHEWAKPPTFAAKQLRVFLVSGDRVLIKEVQKVLRELKTDENLIPGEIYPDKENHNLMPQVPRVKKEGATEPTGDVARVLAIV